MSTVKLTHKLEVSKNGCVEYEVAVGDIVEVCAESTFLGECCEGKLVEIGADYIVVDSSSRYASNVREFSMDSIATIKLVKK